MPASSFIINPTTQRKVEVGTKYFKKLIKENDINKFSIEDQIIIKKYLGNPEITPVVENTQSITLETSETSNNDITMIELKNIILQLNNNVNNLTLEIQNLKSEIIELKTNKNNTPIIVENIIPHSISTPTIVDPIPTPTSIIVENIISQPISPPIIPDPTPINVETKEEEVIDPNESMADKMRRLMRSSFLTSKNKPSTTINKQPPSNDDSSIDDESSISSDDTNDDIELAKKSLCKYHMLPMQLYDDESLKKVRDVLICFHKDKIAKCKYNRFEYYEIIKIPQLSKSICKIFFNKQCDIYTHNIKYFNALMCDSDIYHIVQEITLFTDQQIDILIQRINAENDQHIKDDYQAQKMQTDYIRQKNKNIPPEKSYENTERYSDSHSSSTDEIDESEY